ncbi:MAG TPA: TonB family protein [Tepidisphaeraceae bacterium]|jgi:TonB family protein|nr:TonB family protein [Tepidisphaeraceae bacterium]
MKRRDPTILIALLVALGAHLAILSFGVRAARRNLGWWLQMPGAQAQIAQRPAVQDPTQQLGEHNSNGPSINTAPGQQPMESAVADARQEQAAMQRDAEGFGGKESSQPLEQMLRGDNGDGARRGTNSSAQSAAAVFGSQETALAESTPKISNKTPVGTAVDGKSAGRDSAIDPLSSGPLPVKPPTEASKGQPASGSPSNAQDANQSQQAKASSQGGAGGTPGSAESGSGNPVPSSDFESYPVSRIASRFIAGKIEARTGRKMKARELPRLGLEAIADLQEMQNPYVVLLLKIGTDGNVTEAKIKRSSGSDAVDLECQRAAYTWWFEPMKDPKTGTVHGELIEFTIYF